MSGSFVTDGEFGRLTRVVVKPVADAWSAPGAITREWRELNFTHEPELKRAMTEYARFIEMLSSTGAEVLSLPQSSDTGLDSIYARDASVVTPAGIVLCRMGKPQRERE